MGTSIICFARFITTGHEHPLIVGNYGFSGIIIVFLMYVRQSMKHESVVARFPSLTYNFLPTLYVSIHVLLTIVGVKSMNSDVLFSLVTLFFSWSYLKFFYKYTEIDPPGDRSEDFTFVAMFPEAFHIVLVPFTTAFYNIMALLTIFPPLEQHERKAQHHLRFVLVSDILYDTG
jgi:hypothetical protein